jgi:hypothetical protein
MGKSQSNRPWRMLKFPNSNQSIFLSHWQISGAVEPTAAADAAVMSEGQVSMVGRGTMKKTLHLAWSTTAEGSQSLPEDEDERLLGKLRVACRVSSCLIKAKGSFGRIPEVVAKQD